MKYCEKCGKEIMDEAVVCPGCGCPVGSAVKPEAKKEPNPTGLLLAGFITLVAGIGVACFINAWIGVICTLIAELLFAFVRTTIQNYIKSGNPSIDKQSLKTAVKEFEASNTNAKLCHIMTIVSFVVLIGLIILAEFVGVM